MAEKQIRTGDVVSENDIGADMSQCMRNKLAAGFFSDLEIVDNMDNHVLVACGVPACNAACAVLDIESGLPKVEPVDLLGQYWDAEDCLIMERYE